MRRSVNPAVARVPSVLRSLPALALAACASASGGSSSGVPVEQTRTVVSSSNPTAGDIELVRDNRLAVHRSTATPDRVWSVLPSVLSDLGLGGGPLPGQARAYVASVPSVRRQLNKVNLSRYLECGTTSSGAAGADTHLIRLQVTSYVEPEGQGTRVRSQVLARATPVEGAAGMIDCSSTGILEARIGELLEARLRNP
jgi:hypothetical protein